MYFLDYCPAHRDARRGEGGVRIGCCRVRERERHKRRADHGGKRKRRADRVVRILTRDTAVRVGGLD